MSLPQIAHLVLAHKHPEQLARLVASLAHPNTHIFIHIDLKSDLHQFIHHTSPSTQVVFLKKRTKVNWGGYSMLEATLHGLDEIMLHPILFDFINLLSETDYPLSSPAQFIGYLSKHPGKSFFEFEKSGSAWWNIAQQRFNRYHLADWNFKGKYLIGRLMSKMLPKRRIPLNMEIVGKSQWFVLSRNHAAYILQFMRNNPDVERFFRYTWGPDEVMFQTILSSAPHNQDLINDNLRYIDWTEGKASPKTLCVDDLPKLKQSGKFFARKFSLKTDFQILDEIDNWLKSQHCKLF